MRIRKSASRLLGSAYSAPAARPLDASPPLDLTPPPPPHQAPCSAPESRAGCDFSSPAAASGELCELSRSPWDLIAELSLSDPQEEDDLVDKYFVHVSTRSSWLFSATMPSTSGGKRKKKKPAAAAGGDGTQLHREREVLKKAAMSKEKEGKAKKKAKVKKEEEQLDDGEAQVWKCKKTDGRRWHCHRTVTHPDTLCDYHFVQKRCYSSPDFELPSPVEWEETPPAPPTPLAVPAASSKVSKPSTGHKPRKKKPGRDFSATEGFYYYAGFGPFRAKRQCRSGGMNEPLPSKQEEKELEQPRDASVDEGLHDVANNRTAARGSASSRDDDGSAAIAGVDEESSDEDFYGLGVSVRQASSGDSKKKTVPWKRWRKPVKARSLKSLM